MTFKAVIFDLDGTLLDSMAVWNQVGALFLESQGVVSPQDLNETIKSMSFKESACYFKETFGIGLTETEIIQQFNLIAQNHYQDNVELKPYVSEFISKLTEEKIKMCVATETNTELASGALTRLGVREYFEFIITSKEVGLGKNHPSIYHRATEILGCEQKEVIIFEDALYAIKCAKAAGYSVIGVFDETSSADQEEIKKSCDQTIKSFKEMM